MQQKIILASASPRRAELLRAAGMGFEVIVSPAEEPERKPAGVPTEAWPMCLAYMKAAAVAGENAEFRSQNSEVKSGSKARGLGNRVILAADTIVVAGVGAGERILNKAADRGQARRILGRLNGKVHRVITGCCLLQGERVRLFSATAVCRLTLTRGQMEAYLDSGLWRGKAGAYGIQDPVNDPFVELLAGDFSTVVGLPVELVQSELASFARD